MKNSQNLKNLESSVQKSTGITKKQALAVYNANLVDSSLNCRGMIIVFKGIIKAVFLGDVKNASEAEKIVYSVLGEETPAVFIDAKNLTIMPSFVDMHAHFRYPGQTQKEDLDSGLEAACAGGFGAVVAMPNTKPVVSSGIMAKKIMEEAGARQKASFIQAVSITKDFDGKTTDHLDSLSSSEFPVISEDGHDVPEADIMLAAMKKAAENRNIVCCHCEDTSLAVAARPYRTRALDFMKKYDVPAGKINADVSQVPDSVNFEIDGNLKAANKLLSLAEDSATERNIEIAKVAGCHIHICHCSTAQSINAVRRAKNAVHGGAFNNGFNCTVEVTPHHLGLSGTEAPYIRALVNPPLRSEEDRLALIAAIKDGTVDVIATDHAPHTQEDKAAGAPGFSGLETAFAVCNTVLVKKEGLPLEKLSRLMSENPARLLKLNQGKLVPGMEADFVLVDPNENWTVQTKNFKSRGKSSPFDEKVLTGRIHATFYKGNLVYKAEK